jgi:hypothetical protein
MIMKRWRIALAKNAGKNVVAINVHHLGAVTARDWLQDIGLDCSAKLAS